MGRLSGKELLQYVHLDPSSPSYLSWNYHTPFKKHAGRQIKAIGNHGYYNFRHMKRTYLVHRVIYEIVHGTLVDKQEVDHRDRNKLNNHPDNLRLSDRNGNCRNTRMFCTNTSGYRGVCWATHAKKWKAAITIDNVPHHIGYYTDPITAAKAYDKAALEHHGEFARVNFMDGKDLRSLVNV